MATSQPRVSIITPSYNHREFIERTLLSVLCQDYPNLEYIVVDGASQDGTVEVLERYRPHLGHLIIEPDQGQSDALNKGFALATGEILAYLNSDDCYAGPEVVSAAVAFLDQHPETDLVYGRRHFIDAQGVFQIARPYQPFNRRLLYLADYIPQECTFWRRGIFERAGNHISTEFNFAMDYELWFRFLESGAEFLAVDHLFGLFRWYPNQKSQEQWHEKGLPEIARLHQKYLGRIVLEEDMYNYFLSYFYGVSHEEQPAAFAFFHRIWELTDWHRRESLRYQYEDRWMNPDLLKISRFTPRT